MPVTVRSASTAGRVVIKNCVATWQAYNTWGGYDLYAGPGGLSYATRSLAVSLDRPYDANGADMFLTYERNVVKLAERMGLPLAYVTSMDIAAEPHLLDGASALISPGHDEYWTPAGTRARDRGPGRGRQPGVPRRQRDVPADQAGAPGSATTGWSSATRPATRGPHVGEDNALVTSDWREPPDPDPESSLIGTIYEGYPAVARYVVASPGSWVFAGTGVVTGTSFRNLVGVEYDRVNPAYPVERPIQVLSHSPLVCQGASSFGDSAYYTHRRGRRLQRGHHALGGGDLRDRPTALGGATPASSAGDDERAPRLRRRPRRGRRHPAHDNLDAMHEYLGDPSATPPPCS